MHQEQPNIYLGREFPGESLTAAGLGDSGQGSWAAVWRGVAT